VHPKFCVVLWMLDNTIPGMPGSAVLLLSVAAGLDSEMGWWGAVWRLSVLVGVFAAFLTLPTFRSQRDIIVNLLTVCPLYWSNDADQPHTVHSVVRTSSGALFSQKDLAMYDGSDDSKPVYLAVLGSVYDVSSGRRHYGADGSYAFFSGLY